MTFEITTGLDEIELIFVNDEDWPDKVQVIIRKNAKPIGYFYVNRTILKDFSEFIR